ncbi:MAG: hypothetical protein QOI68_1734, partial [Pseudonocardiales bacterium]|nr:hypothetical protein [Pseudonocardiales bacterium]
DIAGAEMMLRGFGVDTASAREISHRQLPELDLSSTD